MKEEDVKRADLILAEIKSFVCKILMKRGELHKLEEEKRRNKEPNISTDT